MLLQLLFHFICLFVCVPPQNKAFIDEASGVLEGIQIGVERGRVESV